MHPYPHNESQSPEEIRRIIQSFGDYYFLIQSDILWIQVSAPRNNNLSTIIIITITTRIINIYFSDSGYNTNSVEPTYNGHSRD